MMRVVVGLTRYKDESDSDFEMRVRSFNGNVIDFRDVERVSVELRLVKPDDNPDYALWKGI